MTEQIVVIGGGIAGVSAAAFLAEAGTSVTLVEMEPTLAHHTTGRSAAQFIENLGHPAIRDLTRASRSFFDLPLSDLRPTRLLEQRPFLSVGRTDQREMFEQVYAEGIAGTDHPVLLTPSEAEDLCPMVDSDKCAFAMIENGSKDIDVSGLHQVFVRMLRAAGGQIRTTVRVDAARPSGGGWIVETTTGPIQADVVVNAAGAWGDVVAEGAGVAAVGLQPRRRTAFMVNADALPSNVDMSQSGSWPMLVNVDHNWYVKPDGSQLLCSPADQVPSAPVDAKAEEIDIAKAIDAINADTRLSIRSVASSWAGLRTFAPDESMVIGPDPERPSFVWCTGQGGTGIQTSPAAGRLVADLVTGSEPDPTLDLPALSPARFNT